MNKQQDEIARLVALEKHEIKTDRAWINKLLPIMNDDNEDALTRSDAYDKITMYKERIAGKEAHLAMYASIVANMKKNSK